MPRQLQPCGTLGAYQRHTAAGQDPCDACRNAMATYKLGRYYARGISPGEKAAARARRRAKTRLAAEHPGRYRELYMDELIVEHATAEETT